MVSVLASKEGDLIVLSFVLAIFLLVENVGLGSHATGMICNLLEFLHLLSEFTHECFRVKIDMFEFEYEFTLRITLNDTTISVHVEW